MEVIVGRKIDEGQIQGLLSRDRGTNHFLSQ